MRQNIAKPGFCCLGITDDCMLRCGMCEKWKGDRHAQGKPQPTSAQYKTFLSQLREIVDPGFEIDFGGGEALMRPDLLDLVRYAVDLGFRTTIASNGWLIDERMATRIAESGLTSMILSIDSMTPAIHDEMRGVPGVHARVHKALGFLRAAAPKLHIGLCSIIMARTLDDVLPLCDWSHAHPELINSHLFMAVMQPNNTEFAGPWYTQEYEKIWPKDTQKLMRVLDELIRRRKEGWWIGNSVPQLEAFKNYFTSPDTFVKKGSCNLDRALHVSAIGDVFLCFRWGTIGNIMNGLDIRTAWFSDEAEAVRANIRTCKDNCHYLLNCFFEGDYPF